MVRRLRRQGISPGPPGLAPRHRHGQSSPHRPDLRQVSTRMLRTGLQRLDPILAADSTAAGAG